MNMDALSIALSGLTAQQQRLGATASNIANVATTGSVPSSDPLAPASTVYKPLEVSFTALTTGNGDPAGVKAQVSERADGYTVFFDPDNIHANAEGLVAAPNVSLENEIVNLLLTKTLFKANAAVIKTQNEMSGALLDQLT